MGARIRGVNDTTTHHHHARRSSRLRPRRVAFLAFRLARFSRARAPKRRVTARGGFKVREICRRISTRRKEVGIRFLVGTIDQFEIVRAKRFVRKNASKRHFAFAVVASRIRIAPLRVCRERKKEKKTTTTTPLPKRGRI